MGTSPHRHPALSPRPAPTPATPPCRHARAHTPLPLRLTGYEAHPSTPVPTHHAPCLAGYEASPPTS